jgi:membrane-bound lytic murein transglycosylase D
VADGDQAAADVAGIHVVRSGESLWLIARRHGLTVAELLRYNRLDSSRLTPGQRLRLSAP